MKFGSKTVILSLGAALMLGLTGCWTGFPVTMGWNNISIPVVVNSNDIGTTNVGEAKYFKVLGVFPWYWDEKELYKEAINNGKEGTFGRIQRVEYYVKDFLGCGWFGIRIYGESIDKGEESAKESK